MWHVDIAAHMLTENSIDCGCELMHAAICATTGAQTIELVLARSRDRLPLLIVAQVLYIPYLAPVGHEVRCLSYQLRHASRTGATRPDIGLLYACRNAFVPTTAAAY